MSQPRREVWLALEEAQAAVTILKTLLAERHIADRKDLDALAEKASSALDRAQDCLTVSLLDARAALDKI